MLVIPENAAISRAVTSFLDKLSRVDRASFYAENRISKITDQHETSLGRTLASEKAAGNLSKDKLHVIFLHPRMAHVESRIVSPLFSGVHPEEIKELGVRALVTASNIGNETKLRLAFIRPGTDSGHAKAQAMEKGIVKLIVEGLKPHIPNLSSEVSVEYHDIEPELLAAKGLKQQIAGKRIREGG